MNRGNNGMGKGSADQHPFCNTGIGSKTPPQKPKGNDCDKYQDENELPDCVRDGVCPKTMKCKCGHNKGEHEEGLGYCFECDDSNKCNSFEQAEKGSAVSFTTKQDKDSNTSSPEPMSKGNELTEKDIYDININFKHHKCVFLERHQEIVRKLEAENSKLKECLNQQNHIAEDWCRLHSKERSERTRLKQELADFKAKVHNL